MSGKYGIKEIVELIKAAVRIGIYFIKAAKDGLGADDAVGFATKMFTDSKFRKVIQDGYQDASKAKLEAGDLQTGEVIELVKLGADSVAELIKAAKE